MTKKVGKSRNNKAKDIAAESAKPETGEAAPTENFLADNSKKDKKPEVSNKENNKQENKKTVVKDPEKCGLFTGFAEKYQYKAKEECPGMHCQTYKRQLKKYKAKMKRYC